ncbi:MAG: DUF885 domain-containing protein [Eubacterium sp.]|nr:DUF885 domain-containing protein [Eubacterium sp.]
MKRFKKGVALIISAVMMLSMAACGKEEVKNHPGERSTRDSIISTVDRTTGTDFTTEPTETETTDVTSTDTTATVATTEQPINVDPDTEKAFKQFEDDFFKYVMESSYIQYHYTIKDGTKFDIEKPDPVWGEVEWSDEAVEKDRKEEEDWMNKLKAIDRDGLSETDRISYDLYMEDFEDSLESYKYIHISGVFSPNGGFQERFANYFTDFALEKKEDVDDYISLLDSTPEYVDKLIEYENYRATLGYVMSDNNIDKVVEQCETFVKDGDKHFLIELFDMNIDKADFLTDEEKTAYKEKNKDIILNKIIPTFEKIGTEVGALKGKGTNQGGLAGYDDGAAYYATVMKSKTGSSKTPEEALDVLYGRLNSFYNDMVGIYQNDPDAYMYFTNNYNSLMTEIDTTMTPEEIIDKLMIVDASEYPVINKIPYTVSYFEKPLETIMDNTLAYYKTPFVDDPNVNIIRVNGGHPEDLWATLAHEGFPGHMYQENYFKTTNPSNLRMVETFLGYMEGWAKYIEYHSYEVIDYPDTESDANVGKLVALNSEINMLVIGIIDIEVNYNGWTLEDTQNWFSEQGYSADAAQTIFDVVTGDPGLYQSYVLGYYEMKALRDKAEKELGAKFDPVEYHRVILETGPVQYDILERQVDKYIQENK